jgi:hypothetical protein
MANIISAQRALEREASSTLDILAYNAFVIWMGLNLDWNREKLCRRWLFLEELGKAG